MIIGAGVAGLRCAELLQRAGFDALVLEAANAPGGRVRTDVVDGFLLDHGFQVLLTAYPEAKASLGYRGLKLRKFAPGAMVWHGGRFHRFADPRREPALAARFAFDDIVTLGDKLRIGKLRSRVGRETPDTLFSQPDMSTHDFLLRSGFSAKMIDRFFSPFFGGIFLESELRTSARFFQFLFRMFAEGAAAVPAEGMGRIPQQMAAKLKPGTIECNRQVTSVTRKQQRFLVTATGGEQIEAKQVVFAVAEHHLQPLIADLLPHARAQAREHRTWNRTTTFYYAAMKPPVAGPVLVLNGEGSDGGPINNLAVMSQVSRKYAPRGQELIAVSVVGVSPGKATGVDVGMGALEDAVREHAERWFGVEAVRSWRLLAGYPIAHALPFARTTHWEASSIRITDNVYQCSDAQESPSLQGALVAGRRVADAILAQRGAIVG